MKNQLLFAFVLFMAACLISCSSGNNKNKSEKFYLGGVVSAEMPEELELVQSRYNNNPLEIYMTADQQFEVQFKLLPKMVPDFDMIPNIYKRNAEESGISLLYNSFTERNGKKYFIQRTEGVNDDISYYSILMISEYKDKLFNALIRIRERSKDDWLDRANEVVESIELKVE
jgi:hypothetical protein